MKKEPIFITCLSFCLALFVGCGGGDDIEPVDLEVQANAVENVFSDADEETRKNVNIASQAMQENNLGKAYMAMQMVQQKGEMTPEQGMQAQMSMKQLRIHIATQAANGDPAAQQLMRQIESTRMRGGR